MDRTVESTWNPRKPPLRIGARGGVRQVQITLDVHAAKPGARDTAQVMVFALSSGLVAVSVGTTAKFHRRARN
jgi:hypothetical protein